MNFKILIVEDEQIIRALLTRMITKKFPFCTILEAKNGVEGLVVVESENPDVVILDVRLPMMNGFEMLSVLRRSARYKNIPALIISNDREREIVLKFIQIGIHGYIIKPLDSTVIYARLNLIFDEIRSVKEAHAIQTDRSILLIEPDSGFSTFFAATISPFAEVRIASGTQDALRIFTERLPTDVCISDNISSENANSNERILARKLRNIAASSPPKIYLVNNIGILQQEEVRFFSGCIKRSLLQSDIFPSVVQLIFEERTLIGRIKLLLQYIVAPNFSGMLREYFVNQAIPATIQNTGETSLESTEVEIAALLVLPQENLEVSVAFAGELKHLETIARRMRTEHTDLVVAYMPVLMEIQHQIAIAFDKYGLEIEKRGVETIRNISAGIIPLALDKFEPVVTTVLEFSGGEKIRCTVTPMPLTAVMVAL